MMRASKAIAAIRGRDFITPEDIRFVTIPVLNHRLILTPEAEMEGFTSEEIIKDVRDKFDIVLEREVNIY
jgi:MoxR-like ATPase